MTRPDPADPQDETAHYEDMADAVARLLTCDFSGCTKVSRDELANEDWLG